ncbi:T9SS type A sorting domain-containing protein [candidate division KSB1 bacterium]|nr:T9SS type A sorting domain-containing protein [candidate division KSB1 bacterium]
MTQCKSSFIIKHFIQVLSIIIILFQIELSAGEHPRLLFNQADIPELRAKLEREPFQSMFHLIEKGTESTFYSPTDYVVDHQAVNAGFMYVLTGDTSWAIQAKTLAESLINLAEWGDKNIKGLRSYMHAKAVALTYDFCFSAWSETFRKKVSEKLKIQADMIHDHGGTEQNTNAASNWQGNRFSAAGLCYLVTDTPFDAAKLKNCWQKVVLYCKENMGDSPDSRGWNIEGIGYTTYPFGQFIGAYGIAQARQDSTKDLRYHIGSVRWLPWTIYANGCRIENNGYIGLHPDFGDDNANLCGEGTFGLAFYYCFEEFLPGLKFWYDKLVGKEGDQRYDQFRHGAIYGFLYYPEALTAINPMQIPKWTDGFFDTGGNGYFTYRNDYQDQDDIVAQMYSKLRGNKGHNGPDALSFRIFGLNTPWSVGGGRYGLKLNGHDAYKSSMNTLYPFDPESAELKTNGTSGTIVHFAQWTDKSGYVISQIRQNNLGVDLHKRWFVSDFSHINGDAEAVFIIGDTSQNGLFWQICTLECCPIRIDEVNQTFTIHGADSSTLLGRVLYPQGNLKMQVGKRIRGSNFSYRGMSYDENNYLHFQSRDGDYLVTLSLAKKGQKHPELACYSNWPGDFYVVNSEKNSTIALFSDKVQKTFPNGINTVPSTEKTGFILNDNYPNPFNQETLFSYSIPDTGPVELKIFNLSGQLIYSFLDPEEVAGTHLLKWNGCTREGDVLPTGVYFYQLTAGNMRQTKKLIILR